MGRLRMNPCKVCIVRSMCINSCEELILYLREKIQSLVSWTIQKELIAFLLRASMINERISEISVRGFSYNNVKEYVCILIEKGDIKCITRGKSPINIPINNNLVYSSFGVRGYDVMIGSQEIVLIV